uniref:Uncharacterized protein n=1 Tax=uncultured Desulfobacterium sp. TaxID=201089 RepID=E1YD05_9BACT|nr:unknown protein [uncultured Desulfobacterium sp.]
MIWYVHNYRYYLRILNNSLLYVKEYVVKVQRFYSSVIIFDIKSLGFIASILSPENGALFFSLCRFHKKLYYFTTEGSFVVLYILYFPFS